MECERWELMDQSVGGFRLRRSGNGARLDHHQLVGIRPPDADQLLIADLSWLMYRSDGTLEVGVNVLPGVPRVVGVRRTARPHGSARTLPPGLRAAALAGAQDRRRAGAAARPGSRRTASSRYGTARSVSRCACSRC
jgi:hypothetical protein